MRERKFIEWIEGQSRFDPDLVPVGPGDDCAVVAFGDERVLVTTDQVLDGVHFMLSEHGPRAGGRKAMGRSLSDIAAVGGVPVAAVATVALPKGASADDGEAMYAGLRELADEFHCPLVGGDVGAWDGGTVITVTVFGRCGGAKGEVGPILRSGAKAGDAVCVTGELGGAWRTQRHLEFTPRISEGVLLGSRYRLRAMIDISDGLTTDLTHICEASRVSAEIFAADLPVHRDAREHTPDDSAALRAALNDGEDYELLFTLPREQAAKLCKDQPLPVKVTRIGRILEGEGLTLVHRDGRREELEPCGWEHET